MSGSWRDALAQAWRMRRVRVGLAILASITLVALFAHQLAPYDPNLPLDPVALRDQPPSAAHWFGTDPYGRDVLSRVLFGARISLSVSFLAVLVAVSIGTAVGAIAGYAGGVVDTTVMRLVDALLSVPRVLLLIAVLSLWGTLSVPTLVVLLGVSGWFGVCRLVRSEVAAVREHDFVVAARALGTGHVRILARHVLPHALTPVLVAAALGVGNVILVEAGLSYLGIGVAPPTASWGNMIRDGSTAINTHWWVSVFPGVALALTVVATSFVADGAREALDARSLQVR
jgi:peptide/nickel transport system permease protein